MIILADALCVQKHLFFCLECFEHTSQVNDKVRCAQILNNYRSVCTCVNIDFIFLKREKGDL